MAPNPNILIGFPNLSDVDFWTPNFVPGVGNWMPGAPLTNLQIPELAFKARSVNCTQDASQFLIDLTTQQSILAVAIPRHNLTLNATLTVKLYTDAALTQLVAQATAAVATTYAWGALPYGSSSWFDGKITAEAARFSPQPAYVIFDTPQIARYVLVQINDTANPANFIELNRLVICPGYQPTLNIVYGTQFGVTDPSVLTRTLGGKRCIDPRPKYRTIVASIDYLPQNEAFANIFDMMLRLGISQQCFVSAMPADSVNAARVSFLAAMSQLDPLTAAAFGVSGVGLHFEEIVA